MEGSPATNCKVDNQQNLTEQFSDTKIQTPVLNFEPHLYQWNFQKKIEGGGAVPLPPVVTPMIKTK